MSYYQTIEGVSCDKAIIEACTKACEGQGDGRVSLQDAETVFAKIKDAGTVTKAEVWTLRYCLLEYKFTESASDWITAQVKALTHWDGEKFAQETGGSSYYEKVDGKDCDHGIIEACRKAVAGAGDGRVSVADAKVVLDEALDGGKVTDIEKWTLRLCLSEFNWTEAAHDYLIEELKSAGVSLKRKPAAAKEKPAKKVKVVDQTPAKVKSIVDALQIAAKDESISAATVSMVSGMTEHALPVFKEERHAFQTQVLEMAQALMAKAEAVLESNVASSESTVAGADAEKAKREATVLETAAALTASSEDTKAKTTAKDELVKAHKASIEALKEAKAAQITGDADAVALEKAKSHLEGAGLAAMKEGSLSKKQQTTLIKELTTAGVEQSLISCLHLPASKKPDARESFEVVVLQHLEQAYDAKLAEMNSKLAEAGPAREARAAAVTAAASADEAAKASAEAGMETLKLAKEAESAAKAAAIDAKSKAGSLESEIAAAAKTLEKAKSAHKSFLEGPKASFEELLHRTAPAPAPEA
eukprot:CAMPEP_0197620670 /NCGR_PEP_ID=MMETSP1338-20131121/1462_1 /TAXON_ID=43686 ORGANISM="Pelagodinium beii, Strain RCC1491" /NCGR_SAMPLE_ID=MMETSP1338 /ASSEMBLY_ACC=CAM_ASM_000754 /LENGTH=530 /DNA_ID=CAMNT_0043189925 /DNA_START=56 /DNA_END=1648 /DNA_ORIENTATION=-